MKKRIGLVFVLLVVIMSLVFSLVACNKPQESFGSIYVQESSIPEYSGADLVYKVPEDWKIDTQTNKYSDYGYIESLNAFILKNRYSDVITLHIIGEDSPVFNKTTDIREMRIVGDLIALKSSNSVYVYDIKVGKEVISRNRFNTDAIRKNDPHIDSIVKILNNGLVAINSIYDAANIATSHNEYTSIYRPTYTGKQDNRGQLIGRVKNYNGTLEKVLGFDNRYITIVDKISDTNKSECIRIFNVPQHGKDYLNDGDKVVQKKSDNNFKYEVTYIGAGRFYCYESWETTDDKEYDMKIGDKKYKFKREIFNADLMKTYQYNSEYIISTITNKYYDNEKIGLDSKDFLNGNRMYAAECYKINSKKEGSYDQFILDENMNVIFSLSGDVGSDLTSLKEGDISMFELILDYVDGYGYAPIGADVLNIYNKNGDVLYTYKDSNKETQNAPIKTASLNDGVMIAEKQIDSRTLRAGAFRVSDGEQLINYEYKFILPFVGEQTIAQRPGKDIVLIGKNGEEIDKDYQGKKPLADIAKSSGANKYGCTEVFTVGCYMAQKQDPVSGKTLYAIKNFRIGSDKNIVMPFKEAGSCILYPYDARTTFVMYQTSIADTKYEYEVYRLK